MTILYLKDWFDENGKPRAIPDKKTNNKSFLRMHLQLFNMGIKNNAFFLSLYDPALSGIDPHQLDDDNDPTGEMRMRVAIECKRNVWYFLREVVRLPADGGNPIPFGLHRGNLAMTWCFFAHLDFNGTQPRQTGKAQSLDSLIKIPGGWKRMGDIKVGDIISSPDGGTTRVTAIHPQGRKKLYRITFDDGRSTECCDEHLWKVYNRYWCPPDAPWRVITLKQIRERLESHPNSQAPLQIPLIEADRSPDADLPLDPYLIGALIGDGGLTNTSVYFTSVDEFILNEVCNSLPPHINIVHHDKASYRLVDTSLTKTCEKSPFLTTLSDLGLRGKLSHEKEIPEIYLHGSHQQRMSLIQGLMDTDGTVDTGGHSSFCTTSKKLAEQMAYLIRSAGGICKIKEKVTWYPSADGNRSQGRLSYNLHIKIRDPKSLFRLPRKKDRIPDCYKIANSLKLSIKSIEYVGEKEAQCISVDHPDHLYITDDFIVTHNTICAVTLCTYTIYILGVNMKIIMLTHCDDLVQENVKRVKDIRDLLPPYLIVKSMLDIDNKSGLDYKALKNVYATRVGQKDKIAANKLGRGSTAPVLHIDELAFIPNIQITFPAIMASTNAAREHAKLAGMPYTNLYTTTAGDPTTTEGAFALSIVTEAMKFTEKLYDCPNEEAAHKMVRVNSTNGLVNGTFSYLQLGRTHEWFKETIRRNNVPPDEIARDYLNMWISLAKHPIVPKDILAKMETFKMPDPLFKEQYGDYLIDWYVPREKAKSSEYRNKVLIMGMDGAEGVGRDFTTFVCINPQDLSVVFTFRCNDSNTTRIGLLVNNILEEYRNMVFVPERKNSGVFITDMVTEMMLQRGEIPLTRIFNKMVDQMDKQEFKDINIYDPDVSRSTKRKYIGFMTSEASRNVLYKSVLQRAALMGCEKIYDPTLISEISGLQATHGRIDHKSKEHDDMVIAWLLACYVVFEGRHLSVYGIKDSDLPKPVDASGKDINQPYIDAQLDLRKTIRELEAQAMAEANAYMKENILYRVRKLTQYVDNTVAIEPVSLDAVRKDSTEFRSRYQDGTRPTSRKVLTDMRALIEEMPY